MVGGLLAIAFILWLLQHRMPGRSFLSLLPVAIAAFDFCTDALFAAELFATGATQLGAASCAVLALTIIANFCLCLWLLKFLHDSDTHATEGSMNGLQTFTEWTLCEGIDAALGCYCFLGLFTIEAMHIACSRIFNGAAFNAPLTRYQKRTITALSLVNNVLEDVPQLAIVLYATLERGSWGAVAITSFAISAVSLAYTVCLRSSSIMMLLIELSDTQRKAGAKLADERGPDSADTPPRKNNNSDRHSPPIRQLSSFDNSDSTHDTDTAAARDADRADSADTPDSAHDEEDNTDAEPHTQLAARDKHKLRDEAAPAPPPQRTLPNPDATTEPFGDSDANGEHDNAHVKAAYREGLARLAQRRYQDAHAWLDNAATHNKATTSANTTSADKSANAIATL
jgi:hypothetical protein